LKQSAKPLGLLNGPVLTTYSPVWEGDDIVESLVIAFLLVVGE
jgi:hypothetical protein